MYFLEYLPDLACLFSILGELIGLEVGIDSSDDILDVNRLLPLNPHLN